MSLILAITLIISSVIIIYIIARIYLYNEKWKYIEDLNRKVGITRDNAYIDEIGYLRWKKDNELCHRDIAYDTEVGDGNQINNFQGKDVHHKDENKLNNNKENLEILTRVEHLKRHGKIVEVDGKKYIALCHVNKIYRETEKALLVARRWIPRSQCFVRDNDDWLYVSEWIYNIKFGRNSVNKQNPQGNEIGKMKLEICIYTWKTICEGCEFYNSFDKVCQHDSLTSKL